VRDGRYTGIVRSRIFKTHEYYAKKESERKARDQEHFKEMKGARPSVWLMFVIPATWEAETKRIMIGNQTKQKVSKTSSHFNKQGGHDDTWLCFQLSWKHREQWTKPLYLI
jgi:hypothetical protein